VDVIDVPDGSAAPPGTHCTGCGSVSCGGCGRPLDPPRFCPDCGRRLTVTVTPAGYRARCRDHGDLPDG
jgi:hypothetical protein